MRISTSQSHRSKEQGSALVDVAVSYATLVIVALLTLKASITAASTQAWTVRQAMSDAYLTRESALAQRIPFDRINSDTSLWSLSPDVSTSTVTIGRLPGNRSVIATLHRTRIPSPNNLSSAGGSGNSNTNPSGSEAWRLQSILVYEVHGREYVKSRTTLRVR